MGCGRGMGQDRFGIPQVVGNHPILQRVEELERGLLPALQIDRQHGAALRPSAPAPARVARDLQAPDR